MKNKSTLILILLAVIAVHLECAAYPFFFNLYSSDSIHHTFRHDSPIKFKENYHIDFGIDTLITDGLRTRLALSNQEEKMFSQVVIKEALVDYQYHNLGIQIAVKDFGYGKDFYLYNRRCENPLYDRNSLFEYRWHGINLQHTNNSYTYGAGFGSNKINNHIAELFFNHNDRNFTVDVFGVYAMQDNLYNTVVYHAGTELQGKLKSVDLHSAISYQLYTKSQFYNQMDSWHLINEIKAQVTPWSQIIVSSDIETNPYDHDKEYLSEACLSLKANDIRSNVGINQKMVSKEKITTYFADANIYLMKKLSIGVFCDYSLYPNNLRITGIGVQSGFEMGKAHE